MALGIFPVPIRFVRIVTDASKKGAYTLDSMVPRAAEFTHHPDVPAPDLRCPTCDSSLVYRETIYSGIQPKERWDCYDCRICGPLEYRQRTRRLRHVPVLARHR